MIDKLHQTTVQQNTSLIAKRERRDRAKAQKIPITEQVSGPNSSIVKEISMDLEFSGKSTFEDVKKELITKTLTKVLGYTASASPEFKKIAEKISSSMANSPEIQQDLEIFLEESKNKK